MAREAPSCAVCAATDALAGILVGGQQMFLCGRHAAVVDAHEKVAGHASFDELAALFATPGLERRKKRARRRSDRRMFPPRPELRRASDGRRDTDPKA